MASNRPKIASFSSVWLYPVIPSDSSKATTALSLAVFKRYGLKFLNPTLVSFTGIASFPAIAFKRLLVPTDFTAIP